MKVGGLVTLNLDILLLLTTYSHDSMLGVIRRNDFTINNAMLASSLKHACRNSRTCIFCRGPISTRGCPLIFTRKMKRFSGA